MGKGKEEGQFPQEALEEWEELQRQSRVDDTQRELGERVMRLATEHPDIIFQGQQLDNPREQLGD
jgi:hypothetical protein